MSTSGQQQLPVVPPRPVKNQDDKSALPPQPKIPARPAQSRLDRSMSPNHDRFAQSPFNSSRLSTSPNESRLAARGNDYGNSIDRSKSVDLPTVGEEGLEYAALAESSAEPATGQSPQETRTVADSLTLHAPKPSLPAKSAKDRVRTVTRTDSDRAASFGIGKPNSEDHLSVNRSIKKKPSTISDLSTEAQIDEGHGIPEIGQQVPMYPNAGDVQAPSPAPSSQSFNAGHKRKSSRGLPPGSYGMHGHGIEPQDKLEKSYYQKHPELLKKEHTPYQADRATDHSFSKENLNKIVHESGRVEAANHRYVGTPSEQVGWAALDESASRPQSTKPPISSSLRNVSSPDNDVIHIDESNHMRHILVAGDPRPAPQPEGQVRYTAPILAEDEMGKDNQAIFDQPAIPPPAERQGSVYEMEPPQHRPASRPGSVRKMDLQDRHAAPLEDVEEYDPLFPEDEDAGRATKPVTAAQRLAAKTQRFPSQDIWEDAPESVHQTASVSTPDLEKSIHADDDTSTIPKIVPRDDETPAQAFARRQEELAEQEAKHPDSFLEPRQKPTFVSKQAHLASEVARPAAAQRFPSADVWEDTPDSLQLMTTVSSAQPTEEESSPVTPADVPQRKMTDPKDKPTIPDRPKPKSPEESAKPSLAERPKPQVPARPVKSMSGSSTDAKEVTDSASSPAVAKTKPAVPARPMGGKIAALQAGFMSDLNKRLALGPQAPKTEEPAEEVAEEPKEKAPLGDARKGRARGPQRRAPAAAAATASTGSAKTDDANGESQPRLSFASTITVFSVDPEDGSVAALHHTESKQNDLKETVVPPASQKPEAEVEEDEEEDDDEVDVSTSKPAAAPAASAADHKAGSEGENVKLQTLATNTAGETLASTKLEKKEDGSVEPVESAVADGEES